MYAPKQYKKPTNYSTLYIKQKDPFYQVLTDDKCFKVQAKIAAAREQNLTDLLSEIKSFSTSIFTRDVEIFDKKRDNVSEGSWMLLGKAIPSVDVPTLLNVRFP